MFTRNPDVQFGTEPVILTKDTTIPKILTYFMGKNTPDRQKFIIENLIIEKDSAELAA